MQGPRASPYLGLLLIGSACEIDGDEWEHERIIGVSATTDARTAVECNPRIALIVRERCYHKVEHFILPCPWLDIACGKGLTRLVFRPTSALRHLVPAKKFPNLPAPIIIRNGEQSFKNR